MRKARIKNQFETDDGPTSNDHSFIFYPYVRETFQQFI